jgi:transcriptional regulator with XRE-family HTH domain
MPTNRMTARAFLGSEIRMARETKGISRASLGKDMFLSESVIAKWESGARVPTEKQVTGLINRLEFGPDIVRRLVENLVTGEVSPEFMTWLPIEAAATEISSFDLSAVPGLLQTEGYAQAVLQFNRHAPIDIEEQLRSRIERQQVLDRDDPPTTVFIMDEYVLNRRVGNPKTMFDQLHKLIEMAKRPDVYIQIVPSDEEYYAGSPFMLATLPSGQGLVLLDDALIGRVVEDPAEVSVISRIWQGIRSAALPQSESIVRIAEAAQAWNAAQYGESPAVPDPTAGSV